MILRKILCLSILVCGTSAALELLQAREFPPSSSQKNSGTLKIPVSDPAGADILRYDNGDLIHGKFGGIDGGILWKRPDWDRPVRVQREGIRQVVFNGGQPGIHSSKTSHVALINGDQIPGEIKSLNEKHLILASPVLGEIEIPRDQLKELSPNPFDGKLSYAGPFTSDGWVLLTYPEIEKKKDEEEAPEEANEEEEKEEEKKEEKKEEVEPEKPQPGWVYSGAAFFSARDQSPLVRQTELPEKGRLQFTVSWKGTLNLGIAFHADFTRPIIPEIVAKEEDEEEENEEDNKEKEEPEPLKHETLWDLKEGNAMQAITWLDRNNVGPSYNFGSCYYLRLSTYPRLQRCEFDPNGKAQTSYLDGMRNVRNHFEGETAQIDLRFDRAKKLTILYINGNYATQWTDTQDFKGLGKSLGFESTANCRVRISDIYVTSWNGMRDTALSMEHEERDVALLVNGTDRFSGDLTKVEDGIAHLKTSYAEMTIPLKEISALKFNRSSMANYEDERFDWKDESPSILLFKPLGRLSLVPKSSDENTINGHSPFLGNLKVDLTTATLLRFNDESSDVTDWFDDL